MGSADRLSDRMLKRSPIGRAVSVGVNRVSTFRYGTRLRPLASAAADARALSRAAAERSFSVAAFCDEDATVANVRAAVLDAASTLRRDDTFLLTFSGHGLAGRTPEGFQQSWCLFDRPLLRFGESGLDVLLARFEPGVRILVVANCCHSGGDDRPVRTPAIRAQVVRIASCAAQGIVYESENERTPSPFVAGFLDGLRVHGSGGFAGFLHELSSRCDPRPEYEQNESCTEAFLRSGPFRI